MKEIINSCRILMRKHLGGMNTSKAEKAERISH
jgi:hypothetical protein